MFQQVRSGVGAFNRWFKRPSTTFGIILLLGLLYLLGLFIPQKRFFDSVEHYDLWLKQRPLIHGVIDGLGFTDIYLSPVTLLVLAVFFANLLIVVVGRIPGVLRKAYLKGREGCLTFDAETLLRSEQHRIVPLPGGKVEQGFARLREFLQKNGWFTFGDGDGPKLVAVKNRFSAFGFLAFHVSFLFCLAGGLAIYYSRFSGDLVVTEGQSVSTARGSFKQIGREPKILGTLPLLGIVLDDVTMEYEGDQGSELTAEVTVRKESGETFRDSISVNRPLRVGSLSMLVKAGGVSPLFRLLASHDGTEYDGAWISLDVMEGDEDSFRFGEGSDVTYTARFFPDYVVEDGVELSRGKNIRNPAFRITVRKGDRTIAEGTIRQGEALIYGPLMLEFADLRSWVEIQVVREFGAVPLVIGFIFGAVGLVMRLIFYGKEVRFVADGGRIIFRGRSEYFPDSFEEEMTRLEERLVRAMEEDVS